MELQRVAIDMLRLIFSMKVWINRRVDSVSFIDMMTISRRVSVDLTVPRRAPRLNGLLLLPIALLEKGDLPNFNLTDEKNQTLSLCTYRTTKSIESDMLEAWMKLCDVTIQGYPNDATQWINTILDLQPRESDYKNRLDVCMKKVKAQPGPDKPEQEKSFLVLVRMLARNRLMLAQLPPETNQGANRVIKFAYDRPFAFDEKKLSGAGSFFADGSRKCGRWKCGSAIRRTVVLRAANAAYSRHYHLEVTAPVDIAICGAALYDERQYGREYRIRKEVGASMDRDMDREIKTRKRGRMRARRQNRIRKEIDASKGSEEVFYSSIERVFLPTTRCDLYSKYSKHREIATGTRGRAVLVFAPVRRMWMMATAIVSLIASFLLFLLACLYWRPPNQSEVASEIEVLAAIALIGVLFTTLMQPEEENFARYLVSRMRRSSAKSAVIVAIVIPLSSFLAAVGLKCAAAAFSAAGALAVAVIGGCLLCLWWNCVNPSVVKLPRRKLKNTLEDFIEYRGSVLIPFTHRERYYPVSSEDHESIFEHSDLSKTAVQDFIGRLLAPGEARESWWVRPEKVAVRS